jgi:hypothetical protein
VHLIAGLLHQVGRPLPPVGRLERQPPVAMRRFSAVCCRQSGVSWSRQSRQMIWLQPRPGTRVAWVWLAPRARAWLWMSAARGWWRRPASERVQNASLLAVTRRAELRVFALARFDPDWGLAGVGGERAR